jgi:hypothetical protein
MIHRFITLTKGIAMKNANETQSNEHVAPAPKLRTDVKAGMTRHDLQDPDCDDPFPGPVAGPWDV